MKKKSEHTDNTIRHRSTFAILFYINRTKMRKDGTCQLLCKVSIDAEWEQIGTKVSVNPDIWNPEKGRANGRSANAVIVNRAIDELTEEITGHYNRIKNSLGFITAELVKNAVMGVGLKPLTLLALFREHNEDFRRRVGLDRIKETLDSYLRSYKHLSAFIKDKKGVYNPQIQISAESETKRSIFRKRDKTKRSKKESAQHSKSRNKSFVMTSVSAL